MSEVTGAPAPVAPPGGDIPVTTSDAPVVGDVQQPVVADEPVKQPRTYTEEEHRRGISERLSKERRRLERTLRAEMERDFYKNQVETAKSQQQQAPKGRPQLKDFENDPDGYMDALTDWKIEQREAARAKESEGKKSAEEAERQQEQATREMFDAVQKGAGKYKDFQEVAFAEDLEVSESLAKAIVRGSDVPADVLYHLGQNPELASRLSAMTYERQIREVAALEAKLTAKPQPTKAPAPITPVNPTAGAGKDYSQMSTAEHVNAWRNRKNR